MSNPALFLLPADEKFNGDNWLAFKTTIMDAAEARGVLGYLNGEITPPPIPSPLEIPLPPATSYWGSPTPTPDEWAQRNAYAKGMVTLNVINPVGQGVKRDGTAAETWASLTSIHDIKSDLALINAEEALSAIKFTEGGNIGAHFAELRTAWGKANAQGADISDTKFRMYVLKSMPKTANWVALLGSLVSETTSATVIARLTMHAILTESDSGSNITLAKSAHALSAQAGGRRPVRNPELLCTNLPACGRRGHTADKCFRPGGGMEGQYPEWWKGPRTHASNTPAPPKAPQPTANSAVAPATNSATSRCLAFSATTIALARGSPAPSYADSAASRHFFVDRADFVTYEASAENVGRTASGGEFTILGKGRVRKFVAYEGETIELTFDDALHTPDLDHNLISIGCLDRKGCVVVFGGGCATFYGPDSKPFMRGAAHNATMYRLDFISPPSALSARSLKHPADFETWHRRLGHVGESVLRGMLHGQVVEGLDVTKTSSKGRCEDCIMGKHARRPFDTEVVPECAPNERVAFDLWGPARVKTTGGKLYMMLACDQGGAGTEGYFLADKMKETTVEALAAYHVTSERQTGVVLKVVRTDGGGEFVNALWKEYCQRFGIVHETVAPHSSAANGVVERMNRTVLDRGRSMLVDSGLPATYWGEAMATAIYLSNFIPSSRHPGKSPHEIRTGEKPHIAHLRPFGCVAYAKVPQEDGGSKLDPRSVKCVLLGYFGRGDYKLLDRSTGRTFRSCDVIFEEGPPNRTLVAEEDEPIDDLPELTIVDDLLPPDHTAIEPPVAEGPPVAAVEPELRRSARIKSASAAALDAAATEADIAAAAGRGLDWAKANKIPTGTALSATTTDIDTWIPKSYSEAMKRPDLWKGPMDEEMERMKERKVWTLVERPPGARTMKNRWTFALKYDTDGKVSGRKARLVAKGFSQIPGVDFFASYASVVRYESLRINLALGAVEDLEIWQIDYTSAYLNAPNQVPVLMEQPEGYEMTVSQILQITPSSGVTIRDGERAEDTRELVALVDKAIYGTMDGAHNWWKALDGDMARLGFTRSRADQSVRTRVDGEEKTVTSTYTDDTTGMSTSTAEWHRAVRELGGNYKIKDLGTIKFVLGIRVIRDRETRLLTMDQEEYLKRVLDRHGMSDCMPKYTPLPPGVVLNKSQAPATDEDRHFMKDKPYSEILGAVMYAQIGTRPDLSFAVASLSRYSSNPGRAHWQALTHVLQYIKATLHYKLRYGGTGYDNYTPYGYVDSYFAADTDTRRSVSGHIFFQAGGPTCWGAKYQSTVATSTTEAEYMAMGRAVEQVLWMYSSLAEITYPQPRPAILRADNNGAISIAENKRNHNRVKHIDVRHHFLRERVEAGDIELQYIPSTENIADLFTKALPRPAHHQFCVALRLCDP